MLRENDGTRHGNPSGAVDNNPELNTLMDDMSEAGMRVTKAWKEMWQTALEYAWGQQLKNWKLNENWEYVIINRIFPLMFQTIAKLAGNNPKIMVNPWDQEAEGATDFAAKWAGHLQFLWESPYELNMRLKLIKGLLDAALFGYMVGKVRWDRKPRSGWSVQDKRWVGKVAQDFIHPALFWADPSSESMDTAENCGTKRRVKLEWAQNRWPTFKDEIEAEAFTAAEEEHSDDAAIVYKNQKGSTLSVDRQLQFSRLVSLIKSQGGLTGDSSTINEEAGSEQKYVWIEEMYWRDYSELEVEIEDNVDRQELVQNGQVIEEEGTGLLLDPETRAPMKREDFPRETVAKFKEPKFPNGRFALRVGRTILNPEEDEQVYKETRWPYFIMPYQILPHMWQGGNAIEQARHNNDIMNMTVSSIFQQVRRSADPTKIMEAGSLAKDRAGKIRTKIDDIIGKLGRIVVVAKGKIDRVRNLDVPPLDPSTLILADMLQKDIDNQEFNQPVSRGETSKGQQTKAEVIRLNRNSLEFVTLQGIFLDKFIDDTMTLVAELAQRNYEPERLLKILQDDSPGGFKADQQFLDVRFDVNIVPGSTLPFDEFQRQTEHQAAYNLLENPVPNPMIEEMLMAYNIPKRNEILARYKGLVLFRQFMQMGQIVGQIPPEKIQAFIEATTLPELQPLVDLLLQAGQLAPQAGIAVER